MKSPVRAALLAALLCACAVGADAVENPFSDVAVLDMSGDEEMAYIASKMNSIYRPEGSRGFRAQSGEYEVPDGWTMSRTVHDGVPVEKYVHENRSDRNVIFLHGGAYVMELNDLYRNWGLHLGDVMYARTVFMVDYRASGDHRRYPSPLNDALTAYKAILETGIDPKKTVIVGDSAGGNLVSSLALAVRDALLPLSAALVLISPWNDVGAGLPSRSTRLKSDLVLGEINRAFNPEIFNPTYAQGLNKQDPQISPVHASLKGLPPMLITAGGDEMLLDDAAIFAAHAQADGVKTTFKIYPGMSHDWTIFLPELPESKQMEHDMKEFVRKHVW